MLEFTVSAHLERDGYVVLDEATASFLNSLEETENVRKALSLSSLTRDKIRRWREGVRDVLGSDPLKQEGRHLVLSDTGRELLEEYERKSSALRVHLASDFRVPLLAVDGLLLQDDRLVAIKRKYYPFRARYCLPGGIVEYGETVEEAVVREVYEETGLRTEVVSLVGVYSDPDRDPRGHVISLAFALEVIGGELLSGSDATEVGLLDLDSLPEMGFDHNTIVDDFVRRRLS